MVGGYPWLPAIGLMLFSQGSCQPHEAQLPCAPQELTGLPEVADAGTTHPLRMSYLPSTQLLPGSTPESIATWGPAKFVAMDPRGGYFEDQVSRSAPQHEVHWGNPTWLTIPATASNVVGSAHPLYEPNLNFLELAQGAVLPNAPLRGRHTSDMGNTLFRPVAESRTLLPGAPVPSYPPVTLHTAGDPLNFVTNLYLPGNLQQPSWAASTEFARPFNPLNAKVPVSQFAELLERYDAPVLGHYGLDHQAFETSKSSPAATSPKSGLPLEISRDLIKSVGGAPSSQFLQSAGGASKHLEPIPTASIVQVSSALQVRRSNMKGGGVKALHKSGRTLAKLSGAQKENPRGRPRKRRLQQIFSPIGWLDDALQNPEIKDSELQVCKRIPHVLRRVTLFSQYLQQLESNPDEKRFGVQFFSGYGDMLASVKRQRISQSFRATGPHWQYLTSTTSVEAMQLLIQGEEFGMLRRSINLMAGRIRNPYTEPGDPALKPPKNKQQLSKERFKSRVIALSNLYVCMIKSLEHYAGRYVKYEPTAKNNLDLELLSFLTRIWNGFSGYVLESGEKRSSDETRCYQQLTKISKEQLIIQDMKTVVEGLLELWLKEKLPGMLMEVQARRTPLIKEVFHVALWCRAKSVLELLPNSGG